MAGGTIVIFISPIFPVVCAFWLVSGMFLDYPFFKTAPALMALAALVDLALR